MADRIAELGAVERVEMEIAHPARIQAPAELGRDRRGDELARGGMIVEPVEERDHPGRDRGAAHIGPAPRLRHLRYRSEDRRVGQECVCTCRCRWWRSP